MFNINTHIILAFCNGDVLCHIVVIYNSRLIHMGPFVIHTVVSHCRVLVDSVCCEIDFSIVSLDIVVRMWAISKSVLHGNYRYYKRTIFGSVLEGAYVFL